ncbi:MAG: cytochrome d ubiquinol oxidase subunit II [Candidatus Nanopelagicales bacterium]|nr:cytochrome d ubiquinol oxidase subunit II [Candidatus Nanopelagicales bacterium]MDZ4248730.1 cytochrome d ubiquinol oxidase subunit II [Candidatus Nanopelagicales bacterium]
MDLQVLWFIVIAVLWTGFFILEGFDFGVGALHALIGRSEIERRVAINSVGPFWDGNEVWLIVGGAAIFAAFPAWYATMFSGLYLALVLILAALMVRGTAFEYRGKGKTQRWRSNWSRGLAVGSVLAPLLIGVGLGDLLAGLPIGADQEYTGTFWNVLTPYGLATGVTLLVLCLMHGSAFLALKTTDEVSRRSEALARPLSLAALTLVVIWGIWTGLVGGSNSPVALALQALMVVGAILAAVRVRTGNQGQAFAASAITIGAAVASLFASLYPNVMVSSTSAANNLTVAGTASGDYALRIMSIVAVVLFPVVLIYQGWTYHVFRKRVSAPAQS